MAGVIGSFVFRFLPVLLILQLIILTNCGLREEQLFVDFAKKYNKNYTDFEEYSYRYTVFQNTLQRIDKLNDGRPHQEAALYGITQYADLTPGEFRTKVLKHRPSQNVVADTAELSQDAGRRKRSVNSVVTRVQPDRFDWRDQKVVGAVRNQGDCGACWAFSTVETVETMYAIKTGQLPELSVQQVIDCAYNGNYGCQGGDTCAALAWMNVTKVHIIPERDYPFTHATGVCKDKNPPKGIQVQSYTCKDYLNNELAMVDSIATHGPLVVAVDATMWQDYLGGIIKYHCETVHNHAVQIVGYDLTGPVPYFIVRNSWGTDFGLSGYLNIAIGKNLCGIAREVASVDVV